MMFLINTVIEYLNIQRPWMLKIQPYIKAGYRAEYYSEINAKGKIRKHVIVVSQDDLENDGRNLDTLIAHEFIHAWQAEYKPYSSIHGKNFQTKAAELEDYLQGAGFENVKGIYLENIDEKN